MVVRSRRIVLWLDSGVRPVRGYRRTAARSMATAEYYLKQVELLLLWAKATAAPDLKANLLLRALEFLGHIDSADDGVRRVFQEVLAECNAQAIAETTGSR